jgi:hypothetical protein
MTTPSRTTTPRVRYVYRANLTTATPDFASWVPLPPARGSISGPALGFLLAPARSSDRSMSPYADRLAELGFDSRQSIVKARLLALMTTF